MSQRAIVKVTGIGKGTVYRELAGAPLGQVITGTAGKSYRPKRKPKPKPPKPEQPITTEPPGGVTENTPGQTVRMKRALEIAKAATDATEPAPDDSDTGPDLGIALSGIAAALDRLVVYVTALDTDARLKLLDDHFDAINDVSRKLQRTIEALRALQKIRAQEKEG
jgi:hypothetical protein